MSISTSGFSEERKKEIRNFLDKHHDQIVCTQIVNVCPGCRNFTGNMHLSKDGGECPYLFGEDDSPKPCPFFRPDNFYYDYTLGRYQCRMWE